MNTIPMNVQTPTTAITNEATTAIMKRLPWSLALAAIPFIPDILETIRSIPGQIARYGYGLQVKHGQTAVHFNRADIVGDVVTEGAIDEQSD